MGLMYCYTSDNVYLGSVQCWVAKGEEHYFGDILYVCTGHDKKHIFGGLSAIAIMERSDK